MSLRQQAELESLKQRVDDQDDVIEALWARLEELENKGHNNTEKRGRPKKVANG